jgi:Cu/Ag efflux protein CusF
MSTVRMSALVLGAFLCLSAVAVAVATAAPTTALAKTSAPQASIHDAKGVVKFVDSSTLVIRQISPYNGRSMTFSMRPSTEREGDLRVGSTVAVRYQNAPNQRIATVVAVEHAKLPPHYSPSHS